MTLKQIQEEEIKKFNALMGEIGHKTITTGKPVDTEAMVKQFLLSAMEASARGAIENVIENAGELFEQWQGDGYVDRTSVIKQQLSTKAKDYVKEFDNQIP